MNKKIGFSVIIASIFISLSCPSYAGSFSITNTIVDKDADMNSVCKAEFGASYQLADWANNIKPSYTNGLEIDKIIPHPENGGEINVWVSNSGDTFWNGTRHYLATRFPTDHVLPTAYSYLAHDNMDNYLLALGSWYTNRRILCYSENSENAIADLKDGLIAHYEFEGNTNDSSGNGNNGINDGAILTKDRFGNDNTAYKFSGNKDRIYIPNSTTLNLSTGELSIAAWVNTSQSGIWKRIVTKRANVNTGNWYSLAIYEGRAWFEIYAAGNLKSTTIVNDGKWHFIAITRNLTTQKFSIYVDGNLENSMNDEGKNLDSDSALLEIGDWANESYDSGTFNGVIDDIRIYNRALSESEIQELYQDQGKENCSIPEVIIANNTIMLSDNNHFTLLEKGNVFGTNGNETVKIAGTPNANIDSNIERIEFSKNLDNYTFSLTGNILIVRNTYGVVANITASDRLLKLAFKDGSVNFNLTGLDNGVFSEGALILSNNFDIANIKAILNTNDPSDSTLVNIGSIVSQCAQ